MTTCVSRLLPPYQNLQGTLLDKIAVVLDNGAIVMFNFALNSYIIANRAFNNPDLVITTQADKEDYVSYQNGARANQYDLYGDVGPGTYDMVLIDGYGGQVIQNLVIQNSLGQLLRPRPGENYIQVSFLFVAGEKTLPELEALIVPINVNADWVELDSQAPSFIRNKPDFITRSELDDIINNEIAQIIQDEVQRQLVPVIEQVNEATDTANNAAQAANDAAAAASDKYTRAEVDAFFEEQTAKTIATLGE